MRTSDYVVSSYVPSLTSLINARRGWVPISRSQLTGLVVCEASDAASPGYLPYAAKEVDIVRGCFEAAEARVLNAPSTRTSVSELRALLGETQAHVLHLACHGIQDSNPLKSAIVLQDGTLQIEDIMRLSLPHAVLAFLSACQTAKGDKSAPDQAIHIAASMLFCGFKSVIGTMWYVRGFSEGTAHLLTSVFLLNAGSCTTQTAQTSHGVSTRFCSARNRLTSMTWLMPLTRVLQRFARRVYQHSGGRSSCTWVARRAKQDVLHSTKVWI
jgi:hypothetical protein